MMTNLTKICRRCNQEKALTDFRKGRVCRDCEREKSRQYAAEHQTQMKAYRKAHPDMVKATKKKYQHIQNRINLNKLLVVATRSLYLIY